MNWKGWVILIVIIGLALGGIGFHFISQALEAEQYRKWETPIEDATRGKIDVTNIRDEKVTNAGTLLRIYLYGEGATRAPLTEEEFEAVDAVFMDLLDEAGTDYIAWLWVRPGSNDEWRTVTMTVCEAATLIASRDNPAIPTGCQTQQSFDLTETRDIAWLND